MKSLPTNMSRVVSIVNQKGGVGKTTTAVNLAAALALQGKKVLLIDLDPQANATSGLGFHRESIEQGVYHALTEELSIRELTQATDVKNLFLVPATPDLAGAEIELVQANEREHRLKKMLQPVRDRYDFTIIDCPPSLGLLTINAMVATNQILVPMQCEYYALEGLSKVYQTMQRVQAAWNPSLTMVGILLTMVDARTNLNQQVESEVRQHFPNLVFDTVIPRNIRLSEAPSHGMPVLVYDAASRGAQSYLQMAKEFLRRSPAG